MAEQRRDEKDRGVPPPGEALIEVGEPFTVSERDLDVLFDAIHRAIEAANRPHRPPEHNRG